MKFMTACSLPFRREPIDKLLLIMKLTAIILLATCLQVSAKGFSQYVTISEKKASLQKVFKKINQQTGYQFFYRDDLLNKAGRVDINAKKAPLEEVLDICFKNLPITYSIVEKAIVIKEKPVMTNEEKNKTTPALPAVVRGMVKDEKGVPLAGVSVVVRGTKKGSVTKADGSFTVDAVPGEVLEFSIISYKKLSVVIGPDITVNVQMEIDVTAGAEVVVIGYGTQKKADLTGAVSSIQEKNFTKGVNHSALQLLNGRAAGVYVSQSSSAPGGGVSIRIRGAGSINSSNDVLVVIDGLPGGTTTQLSPDDIESIQVLKDASAAAIYGSRAANGVVLITTKKGKKGKSKINYSGYTGFQTVAKKLDLLNAAQYMSVLNGLLQDQGQPARFTDDQVKAAGKGTNWQDEIFRTAIGQNHQLSFTGGADNSSYYIGLNYFNQDGVVSGSNLKKYNARLNYEINPSSRLKVSLNFNINKMINRSILTTNSVNENAGPINTAIQFDPTISAAPDFNGRYLRNPTIALENPLALINGISQQSVDNRVYGTATADYSILDGLTATIRAGADIQNGRGDYYESRLTQNGLAAGGIASVGSTESNYWITEFLIKYDKTFNDIHHLSVLGGTTLEKNDTRSVGASIKNLLSDVAQTNLLQSGDRNNTADVSSSRFTNKLNSFLGRVNYSFNNKYLFTGTIRADGTSRFSDKHKYAFFPSLALGWRVLQEPFMSHSNIFSDLKLRVSYGQMGNQGIGNFQTLQTFFAGSSAVFGNQTYQGVEPTRVPNPDLKWETTEEYNFGLDFGILKGRLTGSVEFYIKNTKDQLFNKPIPSTTGFRNILVNFGSVRNTGVDLLLESRNTVGTFKWNTGLTLSALQNKVTQLPDFIPQIITGSLNGFSPDFAIVKVGLPMMSFYGYEVTGIFKQGDDIAHSAQPTAKPGYLKFKDQNGNNKIDPNDRVVLGSPLPKWTIGLNNSFSYKRFNLDVMFVGVAGIKTLDNNVLESLYPINYDRNKIAKYYLDRWTPANPNAQYPSGINPNAYGGALSINSLTVTDASFIRLKTISLAYDVAVKKLKGLQSASVYIAGDNLFTITKFDGFDPDGNASGAGIARASYNSYPLSRTIRIGINLGF